MTQHIPTTARIAVPYIPTPQDADRRLREGTKALDERQARAEGRERAWLAVPDNGAVLPPEHIAEHSAVSEEFLSIRIARTDLEEEVKAMRERFPTPVVFTLAQPTSVERDSINSRLTALGMSPVTQEIIRATMIEELWNEDWGVGGVGTPENDAKAEEHANFLDGLWQRQEAHDEYEKRWQEQEIERLLDMANGAPPLPPTPPPTKLISVRDNSRNSLLIDRMMRGNQRMRDLAARNMDFTRQNAVLIMRAHVLGVENIDVGPIVRDPRTNAVSEDVVLKIREALDDRSWLDVVAYIDRMYQLDQSEEKNSDSLLEKPPSPNGSAEPSDGPGSSDGSSTISSTGHLHVVASEPITERSSGSTSAGGLEQEMAAAEIHSPTGAV